MHFIVFGCIWGILVVCCSFLYLCLLFCESESHMSTVVVSLRTGLAPLIEAISGLSCREVDFGDFKQWASRQSTAVPRKAVKL